MIGIAGAGAFGTALAVALAKGGRVVRLWARDAEQVRRMQDTRRNEAALPGVDLPANVSIHARLDEVANGRALLLAIPMQALGAMLDASPQIGLQQPLVACCKGVDVATLRGPVALIQEKRPGARAATLQTLACPSFFATRHSATPCGRARAGP